MLPEFRVASAERSLFFVSLVSFRQLNLFIFTHNLIHFHHSKAMIGRIAIALQNERAIAPSTITL
jgi:hypothetical protein